MKIKKRIFNFGIWGIFVLLIVACTHEIENLLNNEELTSTGVYANKNKEMTLDAAKNWYYKNQKPVAKMMKLDAEENQPNDLLAIPWWEHAKEWGKKGFEVVETPMKVEYPMFIVDEKTHLLIEKGTYKTKDVRNIAHLVLLKNLETSEEWGFIMFIVGSDEYMKSDNYFKNTYLHREPDLDGQIMYYTFEGELINGWVYEKGKIVSTIKRIEEGDIAYEESPIGIKSRAYETQCWNETQYIYRMVCSNVSRPLDPELGAGVEGSTECSLVSMPITNRVCQTIWVGEDSPGNNGKPVDPGDPNPGGDTGHPGGGGVVIKPPTHEEPSSSLLDGNILLRDGTKTQNAFNAILKKSKHTKTEGVKKAADEGRLNVKEDSKSSEVFNISVRKKDGKWEYHMTVNPTLLGKADDITSLIIFAHEIDHISRFEKNEVSEVLSNTNDDHHKSMVNDSGYKDFLKQAIPDKESKFYDNIVYAGTVGSPVYDNLSEKKRTALEKFFDDNKILY